MRSLNSLRMSFCNGQQMFLFTILLVPLLLDLSMRQVQAFSCYPKFKSGRVSTISLVQRAKASNAEAACEDLVASNERPPAGNSILVNRRSVTSSFLAVTAAYAIFPPQPAWAKCTDIESCREIGERKIEKDMKENPTTIMNSGVRYKVLRPGTGDVTVADKSSVDLIFSITEGGGAYMYSKGWGYEKIDIGGKMQSDLGLDSLRVVVGQKGIPVGIEQALIGMKRGEKRRVELPPNVGFETSGWKPEPVTRRGKASIAGYQRILTGFGSQPAFPAVTIWDIEVLSTRK